MKREDLKKLELTEEVIDQIMALHGKDVEANKTALTTTQAELKAAQDQLGEANKTIEGFKKLDVDGIKAAADQWKTKAEQAEKDAAAQLSKLKFDYALDGALSGAKAKNPKAVKALLDAELLKLTDDGSISGLKEQLEKIKSENDYLFDGETETPKIVSSTSNAKTTSPDLFAAAAFRGANLPLGEGK